MAILVYYDGITVKSNVILKHKYYLCCEKEFTYSQIISQEKRFKNHIVYGIQKPAKVVFLYYNECPAPYQHILRLGPSLGKKVKLYIEKIQ